MFGFISDFVGSVVDTVVDTASSVGSFTFDVVSDVTGAVSDAAISTASFTFDVLSDVATGVGEVAEGTFNVGTDILGAILAPIFDPTYFDPKKEQQREAAERRFERQVNGLRERSNDAVNSYVQQQKQTYQYHALGALQALTKAQKHARYLAFQTLRQEREIVRSYISQLKPRKDALKAQLDNSQDSIQRKQLFAEIRAINTLLNPLYTQLKSIKAQFDELHGSST